MSWARLDDQYHSHRKTIRVSLAARGLWVTMLSWAAGQSEDGHLPEQLVQREAGAQTRKLAGELVAAGFWHVAESGGGWMIHDYTVYMASPRTTPKPASPTKVSEARSEAGRKGMASRWGNGSAGDAGNISDNNVANAAITNADTTNDCDNKTDNKLITKLHNKNNKLITKLHNPVPDPVPVPKKTDDDVIATRADGSPPGRSSSFLNDSEFQCLMRGRDPGWLERFPHWRSEIERLTLGATVKNKTAYRSGVLRNWLAGDGQPDAPAAPTPTPPAPDHTDVKAVERWLRTAQFDPDHPSCSVNLKSGDLPVWQGKRCSVIENGDSGAPRPGWRCERDGLFYIPGEGGWDSPPIPFALGIAPIPEYVLAMVEATMNAVASDAR